LHRERRLANSQIKIYCGVEQLVARWAHNPKVVRSSRAPATTRVGEVSSTLFCCQKTEEMFTVYVLYSKGFNKIYIGYTSDLSTRFLSHNELGTKGWTIKFRPWEILITEEFSTKSEAITREKQLKSAKGREFIWSMISH
jgi:putative endonuclease